MNMRNRKEYQIIQPTLSEERFSNFYCCYFFWVAAGYYLWKKILNITGYRFHPTDFELLHFYLHNKNLGRDALVQAIAEVKDISASEPWELPGQSNLHSGDQVWYFFYRPIYKYRNSTRIKRTTNEGYWKPTGNPRKIMARDLQTEIGRKRTLVFYKGRVGENNKNKTGWIMHEYELTHNPTQSGQAGFILCKLKRKYGKGEVSCIEEGESSQYLPPNLGNVIANNETQAEAARCFTDQSNTNEILAGLNETNDHGRIEHQSTEPWNSCLVGDFPMNEGSSDLPFESGNHIAENAITNFQQLITEVRMEQDVPRNQSSTNEQDNGNLVPADETNNQHYLIMQNDESTILSASKNNAAAEDSFQFQTDSSNLRGESDDAWYAELPALPDVVQENRFGQFLDDWPFEESEIHNVSEYQSSTNEEQNLTATNGDCSLSFASMIESPHAINPPRKRSRNDYEGLNFDME